MDLACTWDASRPFVHPLTTPAGAVLSVESPADHPWHHALWFTIKFVNGENFWEEYGEFGTLRTTDVHETDDTVTAQLEWIAPDGESVRLRETRTITTSPIDSDAYAIDWIERLSVPVDTVLDRTPFTTWGGYGGLTLRGAPTWTDTVIRLDDGVERERTLGEPSAWLAIDGLAHEAIERPDAATELPNRSEGRAEVSSEAASPEEDRGPLMANVRAEMMAGCAIFGHPANPRAPSPWYASTRADTYGEGWANFVNAAFLWDEPLEMVPSAPLRLQYRVIVHDGEWSIDRLRTEYARWLD